MFYADIGAEIPYLVASMATMFEHVNHVGPKLLLTSYNEVYNQREMSNTQFDLLC